jgi:hypothetical protein
MARKYIPELPKDRYVTAQKRKRNSCFSATRNPAQIDIVSLLCWGNSVHSMLELRRAMTQWTAIAAHALCSSVPGSQRYSWRLLDAELKLVHSF